MEDNPKNELSEEAKELKKFLERPYDPNERWHDTIGMSVGNLTMDEIREIRRRKREWLDKRREDENVKPIRKILQAIYQKKRTTSKSQK